jgi:integrase
MTNPDAVKRCPCPEAAWNKCGHDWYMAKLRHAGKEYAPNVTRYALDVLGKTITTKTEAVALIANTIAPAIRTGAYVSAKAARRAAVTDRAPTAAGATIGDVITAFTADVINADLARSPITRRRETGYIGRLGAFVPPGRRVALGAVPIAAPSDKAWIADLKTFRASLATLRNNTWAKYRTVLGQFFRYAVDNDYRATDPIATAAKHDVKALRRGKAETRRQRITPADEARLLTAAATTPRDPHVARYLVALIVAALETGMRLGELLALQWGDVDLDAGTIYVRAEEIGARKTGAGRILPIFAVLRRTLIALAGDDPRDPRVARTAYVFGDVTGGRLRYIWRPWATAVLHAHGHAAQFDHRNQLTPASRAIFRRINWHFHDLRHEAGCRWLESKIFDLEQIRQLYGHATIAQTAKYLHAASGSAMRAVPSYDAYRARLAAEATTAAAAALKTGPRGDKLGTNRKTGPGAGPRPRLLKGGKP